MSILRVLFASVVVLVGVGSALSPARAQSAVAPDALQAAKELVAVVSNQMIADTVTNMTAQVWPGVESSLRAQNARIDAATLGELRKEFERLIATATVATMNDAPAIYAQHFSTAEMRDLIAFYQTPLGVKTLRVMPQAATELSGKMRSRIPGLQEKVSLAFLNILQKRGLYAQ